MKDAEIHNKLFIERFNVIKQENERLKDVETQNNVLDDENERLKHVETILKIENERLARVEANCTCQKA